MKKIYRELLYFFLIWFPLEMIIINHSKTKNYPLKWIFIITIICKITPIIYRNMLGNHNKKIIYSLNYTILIITLIILCSLIDFNKINFFLDLENYIYSINKNLTKLIKFLIQKKNLFKMIIGIIIVNEYINISGYYLKKFKKYNIFYRSLNSSILCLFLYLLFKSYNFNSLELFKYLIVVFLFEIFRGYLEIIFNKVIDKYYK
tara:strand:+ start:7396 stop:8007 length:612 start_codon:yes stop_codon:yes gene_type:complete